MRSYHYARKTRQLQALAKRLRHLLRHYTPNLKEIVDQLLTRIRKLIRELSPVLSRLEMRRMLGAAAMLVGLTAYHEGAAQPFKAPVSSPFGLDTVAVFGAPAFVDLDADGDLDILAGEYYGNMVYFENTGSQTNPQFASPVRNSPFGLTPTYYQAAPSFADLDGDGDQDVLVGEYYGSLQYFENTGSPTNPQFAAPIVNPFGLDSAYILALPTFADLDGDGDMDLLVGEYYGNMQYYENTGSSTVPQFAAPQKNPFGLDSVLYYAFPTFVDLDQDGDYDLMVGEYYGTLNYFENTGTPTAPQFAAALGNPFGLIPTTDVAYPAATDLDGDGDVDLLVGEYGEDLRYFENDSPVGVANHDQGSFSIHPNPNDGHFLIELPIGSNASLLQVYGINGQLIEQIQANGWDPGQRVELNLSHLDPGIYILQLQTPQGLINKKLSIQ